MNSHRINSMTNILAVLGVFLAASQLDAAADTTRASRPEVFLVVQQFSGDTINYVFSELEFDDAIGFGAGMGYNLNDYLNLNAALLFGSIDLTGQSGGIEGSGDVDFISGTASLEIYPMTTPVKPLVNAGIGFMRFDGTISGEFSRPQAGPGQPVAGGWSTEFHNLTELSFTVGAGVRWDINDSFSITGGYRVFWTELSAENLTLDGVYARGVYMW